ncbi:ABC transporter ATP-binding protein [candidate division KSB1 bacterium]|nr:ABC transporter ATP-binding protein [candidate division KSB1 bacterium]
MIKAENLQKQYDGITVLNLPALEIKKGERFGLVGNNGAGKTTFFSLVLDLIEATKGRVLSNGKNVKLSEHWKEYTGAYLDENFLIDFLTPEEYFEFVASAFFLGKNELEDFFRGFTDFFNGEVLGKKKYIRDLSKGNQKKVGIAAALMGRPEVLVLDEPFPNLDPTTVSRLIKILQKMPQTTMLISSHNLNHVTEVCERIVVLEKGNVVHDLKKDANTLKDLENYFAA